MRGREISTEKKVRRRQSVDSALGSGAMDGSFPDEGTIALVNRFVYIELTQEELSAAINLHVADMLTAMRYAAPAHLIPKT